LRSGYRGKMPPVLEIKNLKIKFADFTAVDNISFSVNAGEIFGFLGANGAGKTTVIRAICGLIDVSDGNIYINGQNLTSNLNLLKKSMGYMSQKFTLYQDLTVQENILFSGSLYNMEKKDILTKMKEIFDFVGFEGSKDELVKNLSGGTKQIISLCSCLLHEPDMIFLDEPTAGISPYSRVLFWNLIKKLAQSSKTIFVTTHYMDEAQYCNRIALLQAGRIIALDSPNNLKRETNSNSLEEVFLKVIGKAGGVK
jgi:ABC-2 type transport system ATP-binding protein